MGSNCVCCKKEPDSQEFILEYSWQESKVGRQNSSNASKDAIENGNADNGTKPIPILDQQVKKAAIFLDKGYEEESSSKSEEEEITNQIFPFQKNLEESQQSRKSTKIDLEKADLEDKLNIDIEEGYGELTLPDGSVYKGYFSNYLPNGHGEFYSYRGSTYKGNFVNGVQEGKGTEVYADGSSYEGDFSQGKRNGKGIFKWPSGKMYSGEFLDDRMHGWGKCQWPDGREYEGSWANGCIIDSNDLSLSPDSKRYGFKERQNKDKEYWICGRIKKVEYLIQPEEEQELSRDSRTNYSSGTWNLKNGTIGDESIRAEIR